MATLVFAIVVLCLYLVAVRRPGAAVGYVLSSMALEQCAQAFVPFAGERDTLCNYLTVGALLTGLVARLFRGGGELPRPSARTVTLLLLLGYCYATVLWSLFPSTTLETLNQAIPYLGVFVGLAPLLIASREDLDDALTSLTYSTFFALAALVLFGTWAGRGVVLPTKGYEANPLALAQAAGALLIVAMTFPPLLRGNRTARAFLLVSIAAVVVLVFLRSGSRGQIAAALAVVLIFSIPARGHRTALLFGLGAALLLVVSFMPEEVTRHASRWEPERLQGDVGAARIGQAERLLGYWLDSSPVHQIFGLGHGAARDPRLLGGYPHVVFAEVLGEEGLVGIVLLSVALVQGFLAYWKRIRESEPGQSHALLAVAALLSYEVILSFKQGSLFGAVALWLLLALEPRVTVRRKHERAASSDAKKSASAFARTRAFPAPRPAPPPSRTPAR